MYHLLILMTKMQNSFSILTSTIVIMATKQWPGIIMVVPLIPLLSFDGRAANFTFFLCNTYYVMASQMFMKIKISIFPC